MKQKRTGNIFCNSPDTQACQYVTYSSQRRIKKTLQTISPKNIKFSELGGYRTTEIMIVIITSQAKVCPL